MIGYCIFFFFFQAEDGIRDGTVTGVQTCALPISLRPKENRDPADDPALVRVVFPRAAAPDANAAMDQLFEARSEEHTSELQSQFHLVCRLLLENKNLITTILCCARAAPRSRRARR